MNWHNMKKPNSGVTMRRVMDQPDPNENLLERMLSRDNVQKASGNGLKQIKACPASTICRLRISLDSHVPNGMPFENH